MTIAAARDLLHRAVQDRIFPAAVAEIGDSRALLWRGAFGRLTFDAASAAAEDDTIFDLASLTKPMATTTVAMELIARGALGLDEPLSTLVDEWRGEDREGAVVRDLLEHSAGLAARLVDQPPEVRREFEHEICGIPLEYTPRETSIYSDLGFILLGFVLEDRGRASLAKQFESIMVRLTGSPGTASRTEMLGFGVPSDARSRTAPTWPLDDDRRRGRKLAGEVHDNYAAVLGGVAGHAGLFGTASGVGAFARVLLRSARGDRSVSAPLSPPLVEQMTTKSTVPASSRALGWDTMLPTSSCGTLLSPAAFGHTGFTGTSLWIDPMLDRYFVLLTNRACRGGTPGQMQTVRRAFHDALAAVDG